MRTVPIIMADGTQSELHRYDATGRDLHIDGPLSEILISYRPEGFIADSIFPVVTVGKQSDIFYQFNQADMWRIPDTTRAPMRAAKRVDFNVSSQTYFCKNYALATGISIEDQANADAILNIRENKGKFLADLLMLDYENRVASLVCNTSNVGTFCVPTSIQGGSQGIWSTHASADPITDLDLAMERVRLSRGYRPNRAVFGWKAWMDFRRCLNVRAQIFPAPGGTVAGAGLVQPNHVENLIGLPAGSIQIAGVMQNTAAEGLSQTLADIWAGHVLLYYAPPRPSREVPSYGYTFRWQAPGLPAAMTVEDLGYDRILKGSLIEVSMYQDEKIVDASLATLIASVTAN